MPVIFLTTSGTFSPPADWPGRADKIECVGSGGNGAAGTTALSGGGGGGGEYAAESGVLFLNSGTAYTVGTAGGTTNTSIVAGGLTITAHFGASASGVTAGSGGTGSTNTVHFNGGGGGTGGSAVGRAGAGGGGSGGPLGAGALGGNAAATSGWKGSGGGGDGSSASATAGGAGTAAATGGAGGTPDGAAGGNGLAAAGTATAGGTSTASTSFDATHGVSGGGGGGGGNSGGSGTRNGGAGGVGGPAAGFGGGGGGGGSAATAGGALGAARPGLIAVTYTSANLITAEASAQVIVYPDVQYNVLAPGRLYYRSAAYDPQTVAAPALPAAATAAGWGTFGVELDEIPALVAASATAAFGVPSPQISVASTGVAATGVPGTLSTEIDKILGSISSTGDFRQIGLEIDKAYVAASTFAAPGVIAPSLGAGITAGIAFANSNAFATTPYLVSGTAAGNFALFSTGGNQNLSAVATASAFGLIGAEIDTLLVSGATLGIPGLLTIQDLLFPVSTAAAFGVMTPDPGGILIAAQTISNFVAFASFGVGASLSGFPALGAAGQFSVSSLQLVPAVTMGAVGAFIIANLIPAGSSVQVIVYPDVQYNVLAPGRLYYRSAAYDPVGNVSISLVPTAAFGNVGGFSAPLSPAVTIAAASPLSVLETMALSIVGIPTAGSFVNPLALVAATGTPVASPFISESVSAFFVSGVATAGFQSFGPMVPLLGMPATGGAGMLAFAIPFVPGVAQASQNTFGPNIGLVSITSVGTPRSFSIEEIDFPLSGAPSFGVGGNLAVEVDAALVSAVAMAVPGTLVPDPGGVLVAAAALSDIRFFNVPLLTQVQLTGMVASSAFGNLGPNLQQLLTAGVSTGNFGGVSAEADWPLVSVTGITGFRPFAVLVAEGAPLAPAAALAGWGPLVVEHALSFASAVGTTFEFGVTPQLSIPFAPAATFAGEGQMTSLGVLVAASAFGNQGIVGSGLGGLPSPAIAFPAAGPIVVEVDIPLIGGVATAGLEPFFLPGQAFFSGAAAHAAFAALGFSLDVVGGFVGAAGMMQVMPFTVSITTPTHELVATLVTSLESGRRMVKIIYKPYPPLKW